MAKHIKHFFGKNIKVKWRQCPNYIKHFGYDENNFAEGNFSLKLIYQQFIFVAGCELNLLWSKLTALFLKIISSYNRDALQCVLTGRRESHPSRKKSKNLKWREELLKVGETRIKQIFKQRVSFQGISVTMRNTDQL